MDEIKIRQASINDIESLNKLLVELFSIEEDFTIDNEKQQKGLKMLIEDTTGRSIVMVAEDDKKIIGMCSLQKLISTAEGAEVGLVEDVIITKEYRGKKIGKLMLNRLETWAVENNLKRIQLLADKTNSPALEFYKKQKWESTKMICLRKKDF